MKKIIGLLWLVILPAVTFCQPPVNDNWYFGTYAGLQFRNSFVDTVRNGAMLSYLGCATINDQHGNLQFYTNGRTIWNREHRVMNNGDSLGNELHVSGTVAVVPKPGMQGGYYVFSTNEGMGTFWQPGDNGLMYSLVDMNGSGGLGSVVQKNIVLISDTTSGSVTAVKHCNNRDYWVITHLSNSDEYQVFLVNPAGVQHTPISQHTGTYLSWMDNPLSSLLLRVSPNRRWLVASNNASERGTSFLEFFSFDPSSGMLNFVAKAPDNPIQMWPGGFAGTEFSADGRYLYATHNYILYGPDDVSSLFQYDMSVPTASAILNSRVLADTMHYPRWFSTPQLAANGKIYVPTFYNRFLSFIDQPSAPGTACNFIKDGILMNNGIPDPLQVLPLPHVIPPYYYDLIVAQGNCQDQTIQFSLSNTFDIASVYWQFGDPASGAANTSSLTNPVHTFSAPGSYRVQLVTVSSLGCTDTLYKWVSAHPFKPDLGPDINICDTGTVTLRCLGMPPAASYKWNTGSWDSVLTVRQPGTYIVTVSLGECVASDTVQVRIGTAPRFSLGNDTTACDGEPVTLRSDTLFPGAIYQWSNGSTDDHITVTGSGIYWLDLSGGGCIFRDSIVITRKTTPFVNLGGDTTICNQDTLLLNATFPGAGHTWNTGATSPQLVVRGAGSYSVRNTLNGCSDTDTIVVQYRQSPVIAPSDVYFICAPHTLLLQPVTQWADTFLWGAGETTPGITINRPGKYRLRISNICGEQNDTLDVREGICRIYIPTAFSPNGDGLNDRFSIVHHNTDISEMQLVVYNRWGQLVFQSTDVFTGWDGRYKGVLQLTGAFAWMLSWKEGGNRQKRSGTVMLLR